MYPVVQLPKKEPTEAWLKQAFAPLRHYLEKHSSEGAEKIMGCLMFMGNADGRFYYKNRITGGKITFDQSGALVDCMDDALEYTFEWLDWTPVERPAKEERFVYPVGSYRHFSRNAGQPDAPACTMRDRASRMARDV